MNFISHNKILGLNINVLGMLILVTFFHIK
jgi:hypothetical protein